MNETTPTPPGLTAPLRIAPFRRLWSAQVGSNVGSWMQTVGAQWLLIDNAHATTLVSLIQAASLIPVMFLSIPAGVLADVVDRRRLMIVVSAAMAVVTGLLAAATFSDRATPGVLIAFTLLLGAGQALLNPAQQAVQPTMVDRDLMPSAAALGSLSINIARAVGPALAGLILTVASAGVLFTINAVSFLLVTAAVLSWHQPESEARRGRERAVPALLAGGRYVRSAPGVRRILLRSGLFVVPASALWALLPIVASDRLDLGSGGYGLLLGALGVGSIIGAITISRLRLALSNDALLASGAVVFAGGTLVVGLTRTPAVAMIAALPTGVAWLIVLSTLNTTLQLALPAWVRARGLATYLVVFMGGQGIGSIVWGVVGTRVGVTESLTIAAALLVACGASQLRWPLGSTVGTLDRTTSPLRQPELGVDPTPHGGPVLVTVAYQVPDDRVPDFLTASVGLASSRRRTGAFEWGLFRDAADPDRFVEVFAVRSWDEHMRQHDERQTGHDLAIIEAARAAAVGDVQITHLLPARPSTVEVAPVVVPMPSPGAG